LNLHVAVIGSRKYPLLGAVERFIDTLAKKSPFVTIISGAARGVDSTAAKRAQELGLRVLEYRPNYKKHGGTAPLRRNKDIVLAADEVVAFWDLESTGTAHALKWAGKYGKPYTIIGPDGNLYYMSVKARAALERTEHSETE
jgi:hypothetical protein